MKGTSMVLEDGTPLSDDVPIPSSVHKGMRPWSLELQEELLAGDVAETSETNTSMGGGGDVIESTSCEAKAVFESCTCKNGTAISECKEENFEQCISCNEGYQLTYNIEKHTYLCEENFEINCHMDSAVSPNSENNEDVIPIIETPTIIEETIEILSDQRPLEDNQCWAGSMKYNIIYMTDGINWTNDKFIMDLQTVIDQGYNIVMIGFYLAAWWPQPTDAHAQWLNLSENDRQKILDYAHSKGAKIILSIGGENDMIDDTGGPIENEKGKLYGQLAAKAVIDGGFDGADFKLHLKVGNDWFFKTGQMSNFMTDSLREIRKYLPRGQYLVSHTPIGPYLSDWASNYMTADRGYLMWMVENQYNVDFLSIQYYNQGTYYDYDSIFLKSYYFDGSSIKSAIDAGIHPEKLVVGKPIGVNVARNGYVDPVLLATWGCKAYNHDTILGFRGGYMTWMYDQTQKGRSEYWAKETSRLCPGMPVPKNLCRDSASQPNATIVEINFETVDNGNVMKTPIEDVALNLDGNGYNCEKVGQISKTTKGWAYDGADAYGQNPFQYVSNVEYKIPDDKIGDFYFLVEFSTPIQKITWWQWLDERDPPDGAVNDKKTIWKLQGQPDWWTGKDFVEFEMQPVTIDSDRTAGESFAYCWKPCLNCHGLEAVSSEEFPSIESGSPTATEEMLEAEWIESWEEDNIEAIIGDVIEQTCNPNSYGPGGKFDSWCAIRTGKNWVHVCDTMGEGKNSISGVCNGDKRPTQTVLNLAKIYEKDEERSRHNGHDYNEVLHKSLLFYEAQQSGVLPKWNRIPWRVHSNLYDGCDQKQEFQLDLTGGWFDAGDMVKFQHPAAMAATALFTGAIEFYDGYKASGELRNLINNLKFITEYFLKLHPEPDVFYGQVGHGKYDHDNYDRPEKLNNQCRPAWRCTPSNPCTEPAAETAAALASAAIFFKMQGDKKHSLLCYEKAKSLMEFADKYRQRYHETLTDAYNYYKSFSGFYDELVHGWSWLARAHKILGTGGEVKYATKKAMGIYIKYLQESYPMEYSWDGKLPAALVNLARLTDEPKIWNKLDWFVSTAFVDRETNTAHGLPFVSEWGSNRYAANLAFIGLLSLKLHEEKSKPWQLGLTSEKVLNKCEFVVNYILGDNPMQTSYMVGYKKPGSNSKMVQNPHHKAASCPPWPEPCGWDTFVDNAGPTTHILYGAIVAQCTETGKKTLITKEIINYA